MSDARRYLHPARCRCCADGCDCGCIEDCAPHRARVPANTDERGTFSTPAAILLTLAPLLAVILPGAAHVAWLLLTGWLSTFPLFCIGVGAVGLAMLVASAHVGADGRKRLLP